MDHGERYRLVVSAVAAALLGTITVWAMRSGVEAPLLVLLVVATAFSALGAIPRVYDAVPRYERVGPLLVGVAAAVAYALGYTAEFVVGLLVVGAAAGVDLLVGFLRSRSAGDDTAR